MRITGLSLVLFVSASLSAQSAPWARPHIFAGVEAGHDDQPITYVQPAVSGWLYLTNWTTIGAKVSGTQFRLSDTASRQMTTASLTASQAFSNGKVALDGEIGGVSRSWSASTDAIMNGRIAIHPASWATITGRAEHFVYTSTEQSLSVAVVPTRYSADVTVSTPTGWSGQAAYQLTRFEAIPSAASGTDVDAEYAWALAPVPGFTPGTLQVGYSISASNSTQLMYALARPSQRVPPTSQGFDFSGMYSPYYTPRDQLVHSALAAMTVAHGAVSFHVNGAFGFHATENAPHITAATQTPRGLSAQLTEAPRSFNPWNLRATVTSALNKNTSFVVGAEALRTAFYTAETATLSLDFTIGK